MSSIAIKIRELEDRRIQWLGIRSRKLFHGTKISRKGGPGAPRGRTALRVGATGKGREEVILSILDTQYLSILYIIPKYREKEVRVRRGGEQSSETATGKTSPY